MENGFIESFNGRLRDECLNVDLFFSIADAKQKLEAWRRDYNEVRPHSSLGDAAPVKYQGSYEECARMGPGACLASGPQGQEPDLAAGILKLVVD